ncbi:c-type cytochrome [Nereida sp. NH-UV-3]|uniref:c-type cytochrome n=1 Tax=Nereida TaxID=282198 RepID=UPI0036F3CEB3
MSKFLNIFLPAASGTALALGLAFGLAGRDYNKSTIESLEIQLDQANARTSAAQNSSDAQNEVVQALQDRLTTVETNLAAAASQIGSVAEPAPLKADTYQIGRLALSEEIAAWDVDVLPDGRGLPVGSGDVFTGEEVFADQCAACHGDFAEGVDNWPVLAGGFDTLADEDPIKTVGSYWPHLSTVWDYINRSMPFGAAGTLTADETYAIVAYILYSNDMVDDDFVLSQENFADFEMHNKDGFVLDDRAETEYAAWRTEPCMKNCKEEVEVTMRSVFLVETPPEGGSNSVMNSATIDGLPSFSATGPAFTPAATVAPKAPAATKAIAEEVSAEDQEAQLIDDGKKVFKKCRACHEVGEGAKNGSGPHLNGIVGRTMGSVDGFKYSKVFAAALDDGLVWDDEALASFLEKPKSYMKGTKMAFSGLKKASDQQAVIEYLRTFGE